MRLWQLIALYILAVVAIGLSLTPFYTGRLELSALALPFWVVTAGPVAFWYELFGGRRK